MICSKDVLQSMDKFVKCQIDGYKTLQRHLSIKAEKSYSPGKSKTTHATTNYKKRVQYVLGLISGLDHGEKENVQKKENTET